MGLYRKLFIVGLINDDASSSDCIAGENIVNDKWIGKDME